MMTGEYLTINECFKVIKLLIMVMNVRHIIKKTRQMRRVFWMCVLLHFEFGSNEDQIHYNIKDPNPAFLS